MAAPDLATIPDTGRRAWAPRADLSKGRGSTPITIGLVNNMPDAALVATERQFHRLVAEAAGDRPVRFKLFSLPGVVRSDAMAAHMAATYASTDRLANAGLDALIVTGAEPLAPDLRQEPYWAEMAALVDWAERNTISTLWSCLAAHAAILHLDDIRRKPLAAKCSGVFAVQPAGPHALLKGSVKLRLTPHSRRNTLDEDDLADHGYRILTRSKAIGVDAFVRETDSLFLFLQGHPEYDADSLALEYRRDMRRFLNGERATHPAIPSGYFSAGTEQALGDLAKEAIRQPRPALLSECAKLIAAAPPIHRWASTTADLYRNWLSLIDTRLRSYSVAQD